MEKYVLRRRLSKFIVLALIGPWLITACTIQKPSVPVGIYSKEMPAVPEADAAAAVVPPGYQVEVFMTGLIWPTSIDFDGEGNTYIAEAGYAYGDPFAPARILRVASDGALTTYAENFSGPITDILWHEDRLYISHKGKISVVNANGTVEHLVTDLPSYGDHFNNQMTVGPDGKVYFGQGVATNSGVVGLDNAYPFVWLLLWPDVHDVPAKDIRLSSESFLTPQPNSVLSRQGKLVSFGKDVSYAVTSVFNRNKNKSMLVRTRAFQPFGKNERTIKGRVKASGTILRMDPDGNNLEVYAWGLRNPFGVLWGPDGELYVADNGYDDRGSRPVANAKDNIYKIKQGAWYGFPDYSSGIPVTDDQFRSERGARLRFLMAEHPPVEKPWLIRPENAAVTKFDYSTSENFGFNGHMFLTEVGSSTPISGEPNMAGYSVVRINPETKEAQPFLTNRKPGPEGKEYVETAGPRRPVDAKFSPDGEALYIVDIGAIGAAIGGAGPFPQPVPGTGVIWRITKQGQKVSGSPANLSATPPRFFRKR